VHELSICQALVEQLEEVARAQNGRRIEFVEVGIGPLSGVEPQLLQRAFPLAAAGSLAENAQLHLEALPVRVHCDDCGSDSDATASRLVCRHCGNWRTRLLSGDELLLTRVEIIREQAYV
jgi:hydrogenase nickel incorporation protein HypA/HybF